MFTSMFYTHFECCPLSWIHRAIQRSNCYHKHGHDDPCEFEDSNAIFMLLFGVLQIFMSQIPDFHSMDWLSILAALMSFTYSSIGLGLGVAQAIGMFYFHNCCFISCFVIFNTSHVVYIYKKTMICKNI